MIYILLRKNINLNRFVSMWLELFDNPHYPNFLGFVTKLIFLTKLKLELVKFIFSVDSQSNQFNFQIAKKIGFTK